MLKQILLEETSRYNMKIAVHSTPLILVYTLSVRLPRYPNLTSQQYAGQLS